MKKKVICFMLVFIMLFTSIALGVNISINDSNVIFNYNSGVPFVDNNNRTQVPLRATMESFGASVIWDDVNKVAIVEKDAVKVEVPIGKPYIIKNGQIINNDTAALIKDGRTYLPIRAVLEAFGATVGWDNINKAVNIKSPEYLANIDKLNNKISFIVDERLFTLYAFMNYTGYNDENNRKGMHPVRKAIRQELFEMNHDIKYNNYYTNKNLDYDMYSLALNAMSEAPNFEYQSGYEVNSNLRDLDDALREFYIEANIHELYLKYLPEYEKELENYKYLVQVPIINSIEFLNINIDDLPNFFIQVNLLDAYERGSGLGDKDVVLGEGIITGPSYEPNILNIVHELLHGVFNPILDKNSALILRNDNYMYLVKRSIAYEKYGYRNWISIVKESFVRALSTYFTMDENNSINHVRNEKEDGFIMTEYIFNRFVKEYKAYGGTLDEFVVLLLKDFKY